MGEAGLGVISVSYRGKVEGGYMYGNIHARLLEGVDHSEHLLLQNEFTLKHC